MADSRLEDHSDSVGAAETPPSEQAPHQDAPQQMVYRRAPKVAPFLVAGGVLGIVAACFWVPLQGPIAGYSQSQTLGFLAAIFAIVGLTIAALVWLLVDRRSKRRTETLYARRTEDPAAADVALTEDDYSEWSLAQQRHRADETYRARQAEAKAAGKTTQHTNRK